MPTSNDIQSLGIAGVLLWLFIKELFSFLRMKKNNYSGIGHIEKCFQKLEETLSIQVKILSEITSNQKFIIEDLRRLHDRVMK